MSYLRCQNSSKGVSLVRLEKILQLSQRELKGFQTWKTSATFHWPARKRSLILLEFDLFRFIVDFGFQSNLFALGRTTEKDLNPLTCSPVRAHKPFFNLLAFFDSSTLCQ